MRLISMDSTSLVSTERFVTPPGHPRASNTAIDVSNPESYEDLVELLVPVLQERGLMWKDYAVPGGTFRENVRRKAGEQLLPSTHPAAKFRYDVLKNGGNIDEDGHVVIDRVKEEEQQMANGSETSKLSETEVKV
jgi:hypothetical protein